jgi:hypothetical protein
VTTTTAQAYQATSSISLPIAYTNVQYDASLQIVNSNIPNGQWEVASTSGQLPPGLSIAHFEHGCAPRVTQCPQNNFDLDGKATQVGTYAFSIAFSIGEDQIIQHYQVQVLPQDQESNVNQGTSSNKTCESNLNCPAGQTCLVTGPIVAGGTIQKNCYPPGQAAPMLQQPATK